MSDLDENIEGRETKQSSKLLMLAILAGIILLAHLPLFVMRAFYIENYRSTNDSMVFVILPILILTLFVILPILANRKMPRPSISNCTWFRWTRQEIIRFWLLPLVIIASIIIIRFLAYQLRLPTVRFIRLENGSYLPPNVFLLVWLMIFGSVLSPFAQEFFWRWYVQGALLKICRPTVAVLGQAILFGLLHFRPVLGFVQVSLFGLFCGIWCYRRKTLLPVVIVHIALNSFMFTCEWRDWIEVRKIKSTHNYVADFIELSKPPSYDPNNDARGDYSVASWLVVEFPKELENVRHRYPTQWSQEERDQVEAWVASNTKALGFVEKGTQKDYYWIEYEHEGKRMPTLPKNLIEMKHIIFALCLRSTLRTAQGDYELGFNDIETCCQLGKHLEANKDLFSQLVGVASRPLALENVRMIIANEDINPLLMTRFQKLFENTVDCNYTKFDFIRDKLWVLDVVQQIFTDDGRGGGYIPRYFFKKMFFQDGELDYALSIMLEEKVDTASWKRLERRSTTEQVEQYYNLLERACSLSPLQYERDIEGIKTSIEQIKKTNPLIRTFSPAIDRLVYIAARARAELDASIAILGILRYKADTQKYPDSLSQIVTAGYIKNIPIDPYSDKSIVYKQVGDGFTLYSFGSDFDDDGGTPSKWGEGEKGGDQVFWPVEKSKSYSKSAI